MIDVDKPGRGRIAALFGKKRGQVLQSHIQFVGLA